MTTTVTNSNSKTILNGNISSSDDEDDNQHVNGVEEKLIYNDDSHHSTTISRLDLFRKSGQFCDVTLEVESHEILGHRAILGAASTYLMDLFALDERPCAHFKLQKFKHKEFEALVNFIYTGQLEIAAQDVKSVYKTAMRLKIPKAAEACFEYLAQHLSPSNVIGIRSFASGLADISLTKACDDYIKENIQEISLVQECLALPRIQVEIVVAKSLSGAEGIEGKNEDELDNLVVDYIQHHLEHQLEGEFDRKIEQLTEHVNVLALNADNTLRDCKDMSEQDINHSEYVQDYKKMSKKRQVTPMKTKEGLRVQTPKNSTSVPRKLQLISGEVEEPELEKEWHVIAKLKTTNKKHVCIAVLDDRLVTISVHYRTKPSDTGNGDVKPTNGIVTPQLSPKTKKHIDFDHQMSLNVLANMKSNRSGLGVAALDGCVVAMGGYDRGECLRSVEKFDLSSNTWTDLPDMLYPRGRFDATLLNGKLYACGGSNGQTEFRSLECYDPVKGEWEKCSEMKKARFSMGFATLGGKLYSVGGNNGHSGMKGMEIYDPETNEWSEGPNMNDRRAEAGLCALNGCLYAVGGCDSWNCLHNAEVYCPKTNEWKSLPPMATSRRGAGVYAFNGKIYVCGGSDGQNTLNSVEIYDPETDAWSSGPNMGTPRVNVGVVAVDNRLFAVGGFSGKFFLDTIEYLDLELNEWCSYVPRKLAQNSNPSSDNDEEAT